MASTYTERFQAYFEREVSQKAAATLADGAEIEFQILESGNEPPHETFTFTRTEKRNRIMGASAKDPQVVFRMTPKAAEGVLSDSSDDIGAIGVGIVKRVVSSDPADRIQIRIKAGFLTLFSKGYFGVITAGGGAFAAFLASRGLNGLGAIKAALKKAKDG